MKRYILMTFLVLASLQAFSQENGITLSGGYSFATIDDIKGTGYRINGLYEFVPMSGKIAHGLSFGFIHLTGTEGVGSATVTSTVNSYPIYYAPKYIFGKEKLKLFVKGAIGVQFAGFKREAIVNLEDNDFGFYGGGGGGIMIFLKENIFINAEYEIAWASNSWYNDGWMNTASGGLGFRF